MKICILDYGSGNVRSVYNMVMKLSPNVVVSNEKDEITTASHLILPGVGAFGTSIQKIHEKLPLELLEKEVHKNRKPFLGICVGMQVLADKGLEFGEHEGLGWISGVVKRLECGDQPLPHIGWNDINITKNIPLLNGLDTIKDFYFVHSYAFSVKEREQVCAVTDYGQPFDCVVQKENIFGVQFHPEKSQKAGLRLLKNFLEIGREKK